MRRWLINGLVLFGIAELLPGFHIESYGTALLFLFCLGLINFFVKPLLTLLTIPITIVTFGFFLLVINTWMFSWATRFIDGISVDSFGTAFWAALMLSASTYMLSQKPTRPPRVEKE